MDWFFSILRIAGASFPVASSLVQLQAEFDSKTIRERISKLEDPISNLHPDIPELSRELYRKMKYNNSVSLKFNDSFYKRYSKALASLESIGSLKGLHAIGMKYQEGIYLSDPSFIMYLCTLEEDSSKMEDLIRIVNEYEIGEWLDGNRIEIDLPQPVIKAVFDIFEAKGFGNCSKEVGTCMYMRKS
jgi:hypothetical protein